MALLFLFLESSCLSLGFRGQFFILLVGRGFSGLVIVGNLAGFRQMFFCVCVEV